MPHSKESLPYYFAGLRAIIGFTPSHGLQNPWGIEGFLLSCYKGHKASPRVEMPYAYSMAWFATHYEELMLGGVDVDKKNLPTLY